MHEHQRVDAALGDQPRGDHGLSEGGRGRQDAHVVGQQGVGRGLLFRPQLALKRCQQGLARKSLVSNHRLDVQIHKERLHVLPAATRQAEMTVAVLGAADDARLAVGRQMHCLRLAELRILEGRQPDQPILQPRRQ